MAVSLFAGIAAAQEVAAPSTSIVISVPEQKLIVLRDGMLWKKYPVSTSKFGVGDSFGSYKTPIGHMRVCEKIGEELAVGSVIKERHATGEVLAPNSPGRDPIVTRILWLDGQEDLNRNARSRGIYIHGTTEEDKIGKPVSYGCIRMRSKDVQEVFEEASIDTPVTILPDNFPRYAKYTPPKPKPQMVAVVPPPPKATPAPAAKPAPATPLPAIASAAPATFTVPGKKPTATAPASGPEVLYRPPTVDPVAHANTGVTATAVTNSAVSRAMQGSILSAGLPDGPKIPTLPEPPAPKDVPRFGRLTPNVTPEKGLTLQANDLNLTPAIQAADADASARAAAQQDQDGTENAGKHIAFRAGSPDTKAKQ